MTPDEQPTQNESSELQKPVESTPSPPGQGVYSSAQPTGSKRKFGINFGSKRAKIAGIIAGAVILIGGGGAAAYFGLYLPNTPENALKLSVQNTLKQDQHSGKGRLSFSGQGSPAVTVDYSLQNDSVKPAFAGTVDVSVSGVKLPIEFRAVDKAAYLKFGDLSTVNSLISGFAGPEAGALAQQLSAQISNKWIEFDESLIKTSTGDKCDPFATISNEEIDQILDVYQKNEFVTIKSTSSDNVDSKKVTKYDLGLDKEKLKTFDNNVNNLEVIKRLNQCGEQSDSSGDASEDFKGNVEFSIWIDKGKKEVVKVMVKTSEESGTVEADFTFNKDKVDITKPEGAVPAMQIFGELGALFGGASGLNGLNGQPGQNGTDGQDGRDGQSVEIFR